MNGTLQRDVITIQLGAITIRLDIIPIQLDKHAIHLDLASYLAQYVAVIYRHPMHIATI